MHLRVAIFVSHFLPNESGAERQARLQGEELARRGATVLVVTHHVAGLPAVETLAGMTVYRWLRARPWGPWFGVSYILSALWALRRLRGEIDVIHAHQALWEAIALGSARTNGLLGSVPTLIQPASSGPYGEAHDLRQLKGYVWLRSQALNNTAFAAISADIAEEWLALGLPSERLVRTASGVDLSQFAPNPVGPTLPLSSKLGQGQGQGQGLGSESGPFVVFPGRLHPQKNLGMLLEAWALVDVPGVLVLVGDGPLRGELEAQVARLGIGSRVVFAGHVVNPAVWLRRAALFVLPSLAEGMSNALLEAMACGLPSLVSRIGGNQELVVAGVFGDLLPPDDPAAWAAALRWYLVHATDAQRQGANARARVLERYALPSVVDRNLAIYRNLCEGRPVGAGLPVW